MGRYWVVNRPFGFVVSDQWKGEWVSEHKTREAAWTKADRLNRINREQMKAGRVKPPQTTYPN